MEGADVRIRRQGAAMILESAASDWAWLDVIVGDFSDDFFAAGRSQPELTSRTGLDSRIISVDAGRVVASESLLRQAQDARQPTGSSGTDRAQEEPAGG